MTNEGSGEAAVSVAKAIGTKRASGVLLHPTSLPGRGGIGSLGDEACGFIDALASAGQRYWQILPLVPTGPGESPYAGTSAFAMEPVLIDLAALVAQGWLDAARLDVGEPINGDRTDFGAVRAYKIPLLREAWQGFELRATEADRHALATFRVGNAGWLEDFTLYTALKQAQEKKPWSDWPTELVAREPSALVEWRRRLADDVRFQEWCQFIVDRQWHALRTHARSKGVQVIGDIPIFVAYDSAEVWAHQDLFDLDPAGRPAAVAGVPPDYFSETGQLWGNPLYRWDVLAERGYGWWLDRFRHSFWLYDVVRIDHFRGFESCWAVPAGETTAINGEWRPGPGAALFRALEQAMGEGLPIIAEDLGEITPAVAALREELGFPGMKILQFAFDSPQHPFLPHNYGRNCVVYTGTHDNDTTVGWFCKLSATEQKGVQLYLGCDGHDIAWDLIRAALRSVADWAVIPMQDVLALGTEARMNLPGEGQGNWNWRMRPGEWTEFAQVRLRDLTRLYGRLAPKAGQTKQTLLCQALSV